MQHGLLFLGLCESDSNLAEFIFYFDSYAESSQNISENHNSTNEIIIILGTYWSIDSS